MEFDLIIERALVVDGTGSNGRRIDVAVSGEEIAAIGELEDADCDERIDGVGLTLAPGFIDTHTHDDRALVDTPAMDSKVSQGVTTVIAGNCGISIAPLDLDDTVPPPLNLLGPTGSSYFGDVASYRSHLENNPPAINVALLVGHSTLRLGVMGEELNRPATRDELTQMTEALRASLSAGCIGLSSGLAYPPALHAPPSELATLCGAVSEYPGRVYATHMRDEGNDVIEATEEALSTARATGVPLVISHHKVTGPQNHGRSAETLELIRRAKDTHPIWLDVYPYDAGSSALLPTFLDHSEKILVMWSEPMPEMAGRLLADIAEEMGTSLEEAVEVLSPAGAIFFQMVEEDVERIIQFPATMIGSDGLPGRANPHPRLWGTFPRVLSRYVRDRGVLTLSEAVHRMTLLPATVFGLSDRGRIAVGCKADLVLFDPERIDDRATFEDPEQPAEGVELVLVNGQVIWDGDSATQARPGRFLDPPS